MSFMTRVVFRTAVSGRQAVKQLLTGHVASAAVGVRHMCASSSGGGFLFRQLFDNRTYTYTYLLADMESRDCVLIDPVLEMVPRDAALIKEFDLNPRYGVNTHVHADHVTGTGALKGVFEKMQSVIAEVSKAKSDVTVKHQDLLMFGKFQIEVRSTPGHTDGCITLVCHQKRMAFTGDALLIRGCGRTDFQQGDAGRLYESVHKQILSLPDDYLLYPGHDYTGQTVSSVGEEKKHNKRLTKPKEEFAVIMQNLNLPYPREIDRALPANMVCGFNAAPRG